MRGLIAIAACFALTLLAAGDTSAQKDAMTVDRVLAKMEARYAKATSLSLGFVQTSTHKTFGTATSVGTVEMRKPDKVRFDYEKWSFVADGAHLWTVDHQNKKVTRTSAPPTAPAAVFFLDAPLASHFTAALDTTGTYGAKGDWVVVLKPRQAALYSTLRLVVDATSFEVKESISVNTEGKSMRFVFDSQDLDTPVPQERFVASQSPWGQYTLVKSHSRTRTTRSSGASKTSAD